MTELEINELVEKIVGLDVCNAISLIQEKQTDYQKSEFYKKTKVKLIDLIKFYKILNPINMDSIGDLLQREIDKLDLTNLTNIFDSFIGESQGAINNFQNEVKEFKETIQ